MRKKLLYLLCLMNILFLIPPKASAVYLVEGWCEWLGTSENYNRNCPKDCRMQETEEGCNAVTMNSGAKCCRWVKNNILETSATNPNDRSYTVTVKTTSNPLIFKPSVGLPGFPKNTEYVFQDDSTSPIAKLVAEIYKYAIQIIAVLSLIVIIVGGFLWSTAGGNGQKVTVAKQWIFSGLGGLLLTLFSYLLLATININLVELKTTSIGAISRKNIITTNKSDERQTYDDCSMFDGYFANANLVAFNGSPILEACCFVYDKVSAGSDLAYGVSYNYIPQLLNNAYDECIRYTIDQTKYYHASSHNTDRDKILSDPHNIAVFLQGNREQEGRSKCKKGCYLANIFTEGKRKFIYSPSNYTTGSLHPLNSTQEQFKDITEDITILFITDKACWNLGGFIASTTRGKDAGNYCQGKPNYSTCLLKDQKNPNKRLWGYCLNDTCQQCKSYGEASDNPRKCPLNEKIQGNNNCVSNFKCGDDKGVVDSGYCQCNIKECMDICRENMQNNPQVDNNRIKDVCEG